MVAILEKGEYNTDFHPMVDFIAASPLRYALTVKPTVFVSHIRQFWSTTRIKTTDEGTHILATVDGIQRIVSESSLRRNLKLRDEDGISSLPDTPSFSGRIVSFFDTMLIHQGVGSGTLTEPHHTPSPKADPSYHTTSSMPHPSFPTASIPPVTQPVTTPIRQYTGRVRIAQSSALPPVADEPASPVRDVRQGEACPTDSGFTADQDRATIAKSSTLPHDSASMVTSPAADEGSMQQTISELMDLFTSLERQHSELLAKFQAQGVEILKLKERVKVLEDREGIAATQSGDDAPINERSMDEGEAATERISDDTEEMATVLTSIDAATVLAGGIDVPTGSSSIPTTGPPAADIPTGSEVVPTAKLPLERRIELISDLVKYQDNYSKIYKFQSQQRGPWTKKQKKDYYMTVIRNNLGWKHLDREDLNQLWVLVKEYLSIRPASSNKEMKLWVELKMLGVHHVTAKDKEIFKLVEKDYPLRKGLALVMICYKLQVENFSQMANDLVLKIYKIANSPRQQGD
nr:hypothetical protein [Tanacetum cinerariifolium]